MTSQSINPFSVFQPDEFKFGEDLPWTLTRSERAKWKIGDTDFLWGSAWRMLLPLMRRTGINEIMVRGVDRVYVETRDGFHHTSLNFDPNSPPPAGWPSDYRRPTADDLLAGLQRIHSATESKTFWSQRQQLADVLVEANLEDGSRLMGVGPPCTVDGQIFFNIRRFSAEPFTFDDFIRFGSITPELRDVLVMALEAECSMVFAAGTGAGKTTLLQTVIEQITPEKVILTIEDTPELQVAHILHGGLKTRPRAGGSPDDFQVVTMTHLLKASLRMRPDWIICGEIRDSADPTNSPADAFLNAIQTGHNGACTLHAHDGYGAFLRLQTMLANARPNAKEESIRMAIGESIRLVVVLERVKETIHDDQGNPVQRVRRRVKEVVECLGSDGRDYFMNPLFRTRITQKAYVASDGDVRMYAHRQLEQVGIPFFGLELDERGVALPDWWQAAKFEHASKIAMKGRAAYASDLLGPAIALGAQPRLTEGSLVRAD